MDVAKVANPSSWNTATGMGNAACFDQEKAKYPEMDGYSATIVQILCDNQQPVLDTGSIYISDQGAEAIGDALGQNTALQSFFLDVNGCASGTDCFPVLANALN